MKVYKVEPKRSYNGFALVGANSVEEANNYIRAFKYSDPEDVSNSYGYSYVGESDILDYIFIDQAGNLLYGIFYGG